MPLADDAVRIEGLTVRYGAQVAVADLDLRVARGEVFGFLGPNGAGKTSTIRALLGLVRPTAGRILVLGQEGVATRAALRAEIGYLPGDLALQPFLTGHETLEFFSGLQGRPPATRNEILDRLGFPRPALGRPCSSYSTGMRQMIGVTVALQHDPQLLVLDEPTTGLDPLVRRGLLEILRERARLGRSILFSSHVLSEVESCADRVGLVSAGRLRLVDSVAALRARFPRRVRGQRRDGSRFDLEQTGSVTDLLDDLRAQDLIDLEIRPCDLSRIFEHLDQETGS
ncbi:MAG: ABC transporter ATP-binding protein [Planctomycetes bacterium]|nr:ABC transporter ATP-binding protein [Planctomycetota bacterium]